MVNFEDLENEKKCGIKLFDAFWHIALAYNFMHNHMCFQGRGIVTVEERWLGDFLVIYKGETISAKEGERREEDGGSDYRFFFKDLW